MDSTRRPRGPYGRSCAGGHRRQPGPAGSAFAARRDVVLRDARDLLGFAENAVVRSMQSAARGRVGSSDRRRGRANCLSSASVDIDLRALVVVVCVLAVLTSGWQSVREYRSEVGLPPAPPRSQRRIDRLGHRACLQPEHLRLFPKHHTQPATVGMAWCHVQVRDGSGTLDVSVARLFLQRPVAPHCRFAVEIHLGRSRSHTR